VSGISGLCLRQRPDEVNSWAGKDLDLQIGPRRLAFTAETLSLSFSLPNFYFHAVTPYDILHTRGVPLGKRDYEGRLRGIDGSWPLAAGANPSRKQSNDTFACLQILD